MKSKEKCSHNKETEFQSNSKQTHQLTPSKLYTCNTTTSKMMNKSKTSQVKYQKCSKKRMKHLFDVDFYQESKENLMEEMNVMLGIFS